MWRRASFLVMLVWKSVENTQKIKDGLECVCVCVLWPLFLFAYSQTAFWERGNFCVLKSPRIDYTIPKHIWRMNCDAILCIGPDDLVYFHLIFVYYEHLFRVQDAYNFELDGLNFKDVFNCIECKTNRWHHKIHLLKIPRMNR